jgi:hypothetical protein
MPATQYFGDITFSHDRYYSKQIRVNDPFYVKIFAKHGNGVSLLHKFAVAKQIQNDVANFATKNGSTLKYSWDIYSSKFKLTNGSFLFELKAKPQEWNNKDFTLEAKNSTNFRT